MSINRKPMSDADIKRYLPNAKIIKFSDLQHLNSIDELLPNERDYAILFYETSPNVGHWNALLKYDNKIELFDSYGLNEKQILKWIPFKLQKLLGEDTDYLKQLINKSNYQFVYNRNKYQADDTETCGRYSVLRVLEFMKNNEDLPHFQQTLKDLKQKFKCKNYDELVSAVITK